MRQMLEEDAMSKQRRKKKLYKALTNKNEKWITQNILILWPFLVYDIRIIKKKSFL